MWVFGLLGIDLNMGMPTQTNNPHGEKSKLTSLPVWQVEAGLGCRPPRKLGMVLTLSIGRWGEATVDDGSWQVSLVKPGNLFDYLTIR